jgi:hypothetical protein
MTFSTFAIFACLVVSGEPALVATKATPGPKTTLITEPLLPGGHVDYITAINRLRSKGVANEKNGARLLLSIWDGADATKLQVDCFKRELDFEFGQGPRFIPLKKWLAKQGFDHESASVAALEKLFHMRGVGFDAKPFGVDGREVLESWLKENRGAMEIAKGAVRLPQWYPPLAPYRERVQVLLEVNLWHVMLLRDLSMAFAARASLHLLKGDWKAALDDVDTLHLMAEKVDGQSDAIETLISFRSANAAACLEAQAADMKSVAKEVALNRLGSLRNRPALLTSDVILDRFHRWSTLNLTAMTLSYGDIIVKEHDLDWMADRKPSLGDAASKFFTSMALSAVDQNEALQMVNRHYDELVGIWMNPDKKAAGATERKIDRGVRFHWRNGELDADDMRGLTDVSKILGRRYGRLLFVKTLPSYEMHAFARRMATSHRQLAMGAWALKAFRVDRRRWPVKLDEIEPIWPAAERKDVYGEFRYRRIGDDVMLYSIWENLQDDNGAHEAFGRPRMKDGRIVDPADDVGFVLKGR